ncbi:hypothetical protein HYW40_02825 [Candidatus Curtissbacteria bacterium]|nr:hypothetical protein [Candidatus Curtissbacteria bacterium]
MKIQIDHKGWPMMLGSFNMLTNTMRIHAGRLWDDYLSVLRIAECIADDERSDILGRKLVNWDLYTKRLPDYLKSAPKDRKLEFSRKILLNATNRKLNGVFQHEGKHAADRKNLLVHGISYGSTAAIMVLGLGAGHLGYYYIPMPDVLDIDSLRYVGWEALGVGVAWGFNYKIDIGERRARSIGEKYKNKPEWRNIIKLSPKTGEEP